MHPTPEETLHSVVGLLRNSVAPAVEDTFAAAMLRVCTSALERLELRLPIEYSRMIADCQAISALHDEMDGALTPALTQRFEALVEELATTSFEPVAIQRLHERMRAWLADAIDALAEMPDRDDELVVVQHFLAERTRHASLGFNLTP